MSSRTAEIDVAPVEMHVGEITVDVVTDDAVFFALQPAWDSLAQEANLEYPFLTFAWVRTWWECFGAGNQLYIIAAKSNDRIVGIAPLMRSRRKIYGIGLRSLEFIANVHTPRFDFLIAPALLRKVHGAIWEHLRKVQPLWDVIILCQLPEGSSTLDEISALAQTAQLPAARWHSADSPYVRLTGSWESYCETLRPKHRTNLRRRMRRLKELGPVEFEMVTTTECLDSRLAEGLKIEGEAWKDHNHTSIRSEPAVELFYRRVARRFAENGWLRLHFLKVGERRVAFQFAVSYRNRAFSLKPGYDPSFASCSPSSLLCMLFLEHAFDQGIEEYDLLGVTEEWKLQWTQSSRSHDWLFIFSRSAIPSLLYTLKFQLIPALRQSRSYRRFSNTATALRQILGHSESGG